MWGISRAPRTRRGGSAQENRVGRRAFGWGGLLVGLASAALAAPPAFDALTAEPAAARPGEAVTFAVDAHDPDCGPLPSACSTGCGRLVRADLTRWTISGGSVLGAANGTTGSPYRATLSWQAPAVPGTYTVNVSLSDNGGGFTCSGVPRETASQAIAIQVSNNPDFPPRMISISAEPTTLFPGGSSQLACEAIDPEGAPVTYAWTTDLGTVTPELGATSTFSATAPGIATVTCTASDPSGGSSTRTVRISVSGASAERRVLSGLMSPHRLAVGRLGELFALDDGSRAVRVFHLANGEASHVLPLPGASAIATDWEGRLLVGHRDGKTVRVDRAGNYLASFPDPGELGEIADIAVDLSRHRVGVLHRPTGRIVVYDASNHPVMELGATGNGLAEFLSPAGLAFAPDGRILVADSGHGLIKVFDAAGTTLLGQFGGAGSGVGEFVELDDVEVDADGLVYASDSYQSRVQVFNPDGSPRETIGGWGPELGRFKTPTGLASGFDRLVVASTNSPGLEVFRLDAAAIAPPLPRTESVSIAPSSLAFPEQEVGTTSAAALVTVRNASSAPLGLRGTSTQGDFTAVASCPLMLEPGASCGIEVRFAPGLAGPRQGLLAIDTSLGVMRTVALAGAASVSPDTLLSPGAVEFGAQAIGGASPPVAVLLINPGTTAVALSGIRTNGDFALTHACPATLPAGGSCQLSVLFVPSAAGVRTGQILVDSSSPRSPVAATLLGHGTGAGIQISPAAIDFGLARVGESSTIHYAEIRNLGDSDLVLAPLTFGGERPDDFVLTDDACSSATVPVGATCRFAVIFQPTTNGPVAATVELRAVSGSPTATLLLAGEGEGVQLIEIPTLSQWGLALLALLIAAAGIATLRGRIA